MAIELSNKYYFDYIKKISLRRINVGIIGIGYVGLPLALSFFRKGIKVTGFDINKKTIDTLNKGSSHICHIKNSNIKKAVDSNLFKVTADFSLINKIDAILICVPTPLKEENIPDLSYIESALGSIKRFLKKGQLLCLESTTYPGTTKEIIKPFLERIGLKVGEDFFLVYSPEREDPGNNKFKTNEIPKIIGGDTIFCRDIGEKFYKLINPNIHTLTSSKAAEMTKLLENVFRAVNIGLVNELKEFTDAMGIDIFEIIEAAATKPFGYKPFYPGPGVGGHCIPIDPMYLSWKAKSFGLKTELIETAIKINSDMPDFVIQKLRIALKNKGKDIKNSKILILGISYKKNIDDYRGAPSLKIIDNLQKLGAIISYNDPYFSELNNPNGSDINLDRLELNKKNISDQDCLILITDHDNYNFKEIEQFSNLIIDTRGIFKTSKKIIRA